MAAFIVGERVARFGGKTNKPPKKKDQLSLAQGGDNYLANRPDPDHPGGLGAEESGVERTGPTRAILVATQKGVRWAEIGRHYDSANDTVTPFWARISRLGRRIADRAPGLKSAAPAAALLQPPAVGAIMPARQDPSKGGLSVFERTIRPEITGGAP
jgi:hypothetical protein